MGFIRQGLSSFYRKTARNFGVTCIVGGSGILAFDHYKRRKSREIFEYYNLEFNVLKQPPTELVEYIFRHLLVPFKFNLEASRIMSLHVEGTPGQSTAKGISNQPRVFIDPETNGIDIYLPHFYEKDISVGHFLENSGKYFFFDGQPVDTLMHETTDKRQILDEFICYKMPSNEEILARISTQIIGPNLIGKSGSQGAGFVTMGATLLSSSFLKLGGGQILKQMPVISLTIVGICCIYIQEKIIKDFDEKVLWEWEKNTLAQLSKEYTRGLYEMYEKDRRTNVLGYKLAGTIEAKKHIDSNGNTKGLTIPQTEKIAFFRNQLIAQRGEVPEIKDQLEDEDEFYF